MPDLFVPITRFKHFVTWRRAILSGVGIVIILAAADLGYFIYLYSPLNIGRIDFQEYAPTKSLPNMKIMSKSVQAWVYTQPHFFTSAELNFSLENGTIREQKNIGWPVAYFNYRCPHEADATCAIHTTLHGQRYVVLIEQPDFETVQWTKGDTLITCMWDNYRSVRPVYEPTELGPFIDSFAPASLHVPAKAYYQSYPERLKSKLDKKMGDI